MQTQGEVNLTEIRENMDQLGAILGQETQLLKSSNFAALGATYEKKLVLLQKLEDQKKILKANKGKVAANAEDKRYFSEIAAKMDSAIEQHGRELIKARAANKMLLDAIAAAISEQLRKNNSTVRNYNTKGVEEQYVPRGESALPPMRINNVI